MARETLLPTLPVEVVRLRVRRAREIGLDYRTYAGIRASTGHDLIAFLFSSNALGLHRVGAILDAGRAEKLKAIGPIERLVAVQPPNGVASVGALLESALVPCGRIGPAPHALDSYARQRDLLTFLRGAHPSDRVLVIGAQESEQDWVAAGRFAGFLAAERFFPVATA